MRGSIDRHGLVSVTRRRQPRSGNKAHAGELERTGVVGARAPERVEHVCGVAPGGNRLEEPPVKAGPNRGTLDGTTLGIDDAPGVDPSGSHHDHDRLVRNRAAQMGPRNGRVAIALDVETAPEDLPRERERPIDGGTDGRARCLPPERLVGHEHDGNVGDGTTVELSNESVHKAMRLDGDLCIPHRRAGLWGASARQRVPVLARGGPRSIWNRRGENKPGTRRVCRLALRSRGYQPNAERDQSSSREGNLQGHGYSQNGGRRRAPRGHERSERHDPSTPTAPVVVEAPAQDSETAIDARVHGLAGDPHRFRDLARRLTAQEASYERRAIRLLERFDGADELAVKGELLDNFERRGSRVGNGFALLARLSAQPTALLLPHGVAQDRPQHARAERRVAGRRVSAATSVS